MTEPLLPNKPRGVPPGDDRRFLNGIFWRLRTRDPWVDLPGRYRHHTTCDRLLVDPYASARCKHQKDGISLHGGPAQGSGNAKHRSKSCGGLAGGLTTKIHTLVDADGLPIAVSLTAGQAHDGRSPTDMLETVVTGTNADRPTIPTSAARPWPHVAPEP